MYVLKRREWLHCRVHSPPLSATTGGEENAPVACHDSGGLYRHCRQSVKRPLAAVANSNWKNHTFAAWAPAVATPFGSLTTRTEHGACA